MPAPSMGGLDEQYASRLRGLAEIPVDIKEKFSRPVVIVLPVEAMGANAIEPEGARRHTRDYYLGEGIPVYLTLERATRALANLDSYYERRDAILSPESGN